MSGSDDQNDPHEVNFDDAVVSSVFKSMEKGECPKLLQAIANALETNAQSTSNTIRPPTIDATPSAQRSRSNSPARSSRPKKAKREAAKVLVLRSTYNKVSYEGFKIRFDPNKRQLAFNEGIISHVHDIAASLADDPEMSMELLSKLKAKMHDRQEDILVADKFGLEVASLVGNSSALPISSKKMKEAEKAQKMLAPKTQQTDQPFRVQRGGQPRNFDFQTQPGAGPFTPRGSNAVCYKCGQGGHWARQCQYRYGPAAFSNNQPGFSSGTIRPLFTPKSA